jgi:phage FluMu protein Com
MKDRKEFRCSKCGKVICYFSAEGSIILERVCPTCKTSNVLVVEKEGHTSVVNSVSGSKCA